MKKGIIPIVIIIFAAFLFSCSANQKRNRQNMNYVTNDSTDTIGRIEPIADSVNQKDNIELLINNSIIATAGNYELIDSGSLQINDIIKYYTWIVKLTDSGCNNGCTCRLFIFKEEYRRLYTTDINNFISDCIAMKYSHGDIPFYIEVRNRKNIALNFDDRNYVLSFDTNGAYLDTVTLYRRSPKKDRPGAADSATLTRKDYGEIRVKYADEAFFNKLKFVFSPVVDISNSENTSLNAANYNEQAYNLEQQGKYQEAVDILLEKVLHVSPNRVVAYLNLADAYWGLNEKEKAKENYQKYIELMKSQQKDLSKIPQRVYDRLK
jgi:hypothetical protein